MKRIIMAVLTLAVGIGLMAAGWDNGAKKTDPTGTETITATINGPMALASKPVFHLTFHGLVNTTGTLSLGTTSPQSQEYTLATAVGNLVIVGSKGSSSQKLLSTSTCRFELTKTSPYTISGSKSTGKFAGATGSGKATAVLMANLPKLSSGQCNESSTATPVAGTAVATFTATGPLTVK
jgi:hypothetical protein